MRSRRRLRTLMLAALAAALLGSFGGQVTRGDAAWAGRAEGETAGRPRPDPIRGAIAAYEAALAERPDSLEARWKLVRSLHFAGTFTAEGEEKKAWHAPVRSRA